MAQISASTITRPIDDGTVEVTDSPVESTPASPSEASPLHEALPREAIGLEFTSDASAAGSVLPESILTALESEDETPSSRTIEHEATFHMFDGVSDEIRTFKGNAFAFVKAPSTYEKILSLLEDTSIAGLSQRNVDKLKSALANVVRFSDKKKIVEDPHIQISRIIGRIKMDMVSHGNTLLRAEGRAEEMQKQEFSFTNFFHRVGKKFEKHGFIHAIKTIGTSFHRAYFTDKQQELFQALSKLSSESIKEARLESLHHILSTLSSSIDEAMERIAQGGTHANPHIIITSIHRQINRLESLYKSEDFNSKLFSGFASVSENLRNSIMPKLYEALGRSLTTKIDALPQSDEMTGERKTMLRNTLYNMFSTAYLDDSMLEFVEAAKNLDSEVFTALLTTYQTALDAIKNKDIDAKGKQKSLESAYFALDKVFGKNPQLEKTLISLKQYLSTSLVNESRVSPQERKRLLEIENINIQNQHAFSHLSSFLLADLDEKTLEFAGLEPPVNPQDITEEHLFSFINNRPASATFSYDILTLTSLFMYLKFKNPTMGIDDIKAKLPKSLHDLASRIYSELPEGPVLEKNRVNTILAKLMFDTQTHYMELLGLIPALNRAEMTDPEKVESHGRKALNRNIFAILSPMFSEDLIKEMGLTQPINHLEIDESNWLQLLVENKDLNFAQQKLAFIAFLNQAQAHKLELSQELLTLMLPEEFKSQVEDVIVSLGDLKSIDTQKLMDLAKETFDSVATPVSKEFLDSETIQSTLASQLTLFLTNSFNLNPTQVRDTDSLVAAFKQIHSEGYSIAGDSTKDLLEHLSHSPRVKLQGAPLNPSDYDIYHRKRISVKEYRRYLELFSKSDSDLKKEFESEHGLPAKELIVPFIKQHSDLFNLAFLLTFKQIRAENPFAKHEEAISDIFKSPEHISFLKNSFLSLGIKEEEIDGLMKIAQFAADRKESFYIPHTHKKSLFDTALYWQLHVPFSAKGDFVYYDDRKDTHFLSEFNRRYGEGRKLQIIASSTPSLVKLYEDYKIHQKVRREVGTLYRADSSKVVRFPYPFTTSSQSHDEASLEQKYFEATIEKNSEGNIVVHVSKKMAELLGLDNGQITPNQLGIEIQQRNVPSTSFTFSDEENASFFFERLLTGNLRIDERNKLIGSPMYDDNNFYFMAMVDGKPIVRTLSAARLSNSSQTIAKTDSQDGSSFIIHSSGTAKSFVYSKKPKLQRVIMRLQKNADRTKPNINHFTFSYTAKAIYSKITGELEDVQLAISFKPHYHSHGDLRVVARHFREMYGAPAEKGKKVSLARRLLRLGSEQTGGARLYHSYIQSANQNPAMLSSIISDFAHYG